MGRLSRQKGKRGEREFAAFLRERGVEARRGVQYQGGPDSPDVESALPVHWEVKRTEALALWAALQQAESEAASGRLPVVVHRRNKTGWVAVLRAEALVVLLKKAFAKEAV